MVTFLGIVLLVIGIVIFISDIEPKTWGIIMTVLGLVLFIIGIILGFSSIAKINYSQGERAGLVNKLSYKGLVCKTYEGYILVGNGNNVQPVKNPEIAEKMNAKLGQQATLVYKEYLYTTPCWGVTSYEVIDVK